MTTDINPAPTALELPPPMVELVRDATIVPMGNDTDRSCGVFRSDGSFCSQSRTLFSVNRFTGIPSALPPADECETLKGRYLYAGIGRHHFGHFLLESITRLWALEHVHDKIDGVIISPMHGTDIEAIIRRRFLPLIQMLGYNLPLHVVNKPTQVSELLVPTQGFGHRNWSIGTNQFRHFTRTHFEAQITPDGPEKLYVSRGRLKSPKQQVDREKQIERFLSAAGYTIFHPQKHSIKVQLQHYRAARMIVGADGSAFHLAPFILQPGTRVGLFLRRNRKQVFNALMQQIRSFSDVDLVTINSLSSSSANVHSDKPKTAPLLDLKSLKQALREAGFI